MTDHQHTDMKKLTRAIENAARSMDSLAKVNQEFLKKYRRDWEDITEKEHERRLREAEIKSIYDSCREKPNNGTAL